MVPGFLAAIDLLASSDVDSRFLGHVASVADTHAKPAKLIGGTSTSLEPAGTSLDYRLMDGRDVARLLPELDELYRGLLVRLASRIFGVPLIPSPTIVNGVNVNVLDGGGGRYEWHVDSNPVTGLLVFSECDSIRGGRLMFGADARTRTSLCMRPGHFLMFDATSAPHAVEIVRGDSARVTAPMNFFVDGGEIVRPDDLDVSLYGT